MNVIFINRFYYPDHEERRRLDLIQDKLHFTLIELEFCTRNESKFQQVLTKISYHEKFRARWEIIDGAKDN